MSVHPRLAIAFWLTSVTLMPTISATVSGLHTITLPNSLAFAYSASKCIGCVFIVSRREPGVVGFADGTTGTMLVDVADREFLEEAAEALAIAMFTDLHCHLHPWGLLNGDDCSVEISPSFASSAMRAAFFSSGASTIFSAKEESAAAAADGYRFQQQCRPLAIGLRRRERRVDGGDLLRVDRGLAAESERQVRGGSLRPAPRRSTGRRWARPHA